MSYTLGEHFESFVEQLIASGRYATASEVIRDGLRLMEEHERQREAKLKSLRSAFQADVESGSTEPLDMDEVRSEARARKAATALGKA